MKSITYNNFAKIHRCVEYYEPLAKLLNYTARGHNLGNSQIIKYPFQKCPRKDLSGFENLTGLDMGILIFASYLKLLCRVGKVFFLPAPSSIKKVQFMLACSILSILYHTTDKQLLKKSKTLTTINIVNPVDFILKEK